MRSQITGVLNKLTTAILCAAILWLPSGTSSAPAVFVDELTKTTVDREAAKYTRAVNELGGIANLSLKTEADFKTASSIINQQTENLRYVKYRMVQIALANPGFIAAVESELGKANEDVVLRGFRQNPGALKNLNGGRSAQQNIAAALKRDFQQVKTASEHLENAASLILKKRSSTPASNTGQVIFAEAGFYAPLAVDDYFEALFAASTVIAGAVNRSAKVGSRRSGSGGGSSGGSSGSSSGNSGGSSSGPVIWMMDEQEYHDCARQAGEKRDRCKGNCGPAGLIQWACLANCDASYMLTKAACAINSMHEV